MKKTLIDYVRSLRSRVGQHALIGFFVSIVLVILAMFLLSYQQTESLNWINFFYTQVNNPTLWMLDLAPFLFLLWGQRISMSIGQKVKSIMMIPHFYHQTKTQRKMYDHYTELPNRILWMNQLSYEMMAANNKGRQFSVIFIDIVNFKEIEDPIGHSNGIKLLKLIARQLKKEVSPPNLLGHLDEHEFAIIFHDVNKIKNAKAYAQTLEERLKYPFTLDGMNFQLKARIGMVDYPEHGDDLNLLFKYASPSQYPAKHWHFKTTSPLTLIDTLYRAIEKEEFTLCFQPKINLKTKTISGAQALLQWQDPNYGMIYSNYFPSLSEHKQLARSLVVCMIQKSIEQYLEWQYKKKIIPISMNLSMLDTIDESIIDMMMELLEGHSIVPNSLTIEIAESALGMDKNQCQKLLGRLVDRGLKLSIDNGGLEYCSLIDWCALPIQEIKIGQSFVTHMHEDPNNEKMIQAIIGLAHHLNFKVVAQGITSKATFSKLSKWRCDYGQGCFIAKPKMPKEFIDWSGQQ